MDLEALATCFASSACVVTQATSGLIVGLLLFLVAAGLTLIFGVLKIVNFAHGTFYMLGAYVAYSVLQASGSYGLAILAAGAAMAAFGVLFERLLIARVYGGNVLMQLLVCYAVVLIFDDLVKMIWGADFHAMGMPEAFQRAPLFIAGGVVPPFYAGLIAVSLCIAALLGMGLANTRLGKIITAAADNPRMVAALGINTTVLFALVFGLGGGLAGLAGALAAPVRSLSPGMGFSVLIESFIITVIGGMGSIAGALLAAIGIGLLRGFGTIGFPLFTDGLIYAAMILVLLLRPRGLFGREMV
jgi:branched-chain amino acid transport system permease protein